MKEDNHKEDSHIDARSERTRDKDTSFLPKEGHRQDRRDSGTGKIDHESRNKKQEAGTTDEERDRHLKAPTEANRDKHINFLAEERGERDPADEGTDKRKIQPGNDKQKNVYAKDEDRDRHLQAPTEANRDKHINFLAEEAGDEAPEDE